MLHDDTLTTTLAAHFDLLDLSVLKANSVSCRNTVVSRRMSAFPQSKIFK